MGNQMVYVRYSIRRSELLAAYDFARQAGRQRSACLAAAVCRAVISNALLAHLELWRQALPFNRVIMRLSSNRQKLWGELLIA